MYILSKNVDDPAPSLPGAPITLVPVAPSRWRVLDRGGRAIGHLDASATGEGIRFSARRFHRPSGKFREIGQFWSAADAVECLRLSR